MSERFSSVEGEARPVLTWVHHPARQSPGRLALAAGVMTLTALSILVIDGSLTFALLSVAFIVWATSPFLFPTRYTLSERGISRASVFGSVHRPWGELRRWQEDRNGILVSPFRRPSALDDLRGIYLRGGDRAAIRVELEARLGPPAEPPGGPIRREPPALPPDHR